MNDHDNSSDLDDSFVKSYQPRNPLFLNAVTHASDAIQCFHEERCSRHAQGIALGFKMKHVFNGKKVGLL
jgi:hypothetical protein